MEEKTPHSNLESCKEVESGIEKYHVERSKPTLKNFLLDIYYAIRRDILDIPYYIRFVKWSYQRVRYGVSDRDTWSFYNYTSEVLVRGLKNLREINHGLPCDLLYDNTGKQICSEEDAVRKWNEILDNIVYTFEICERVNGNFDEEICIPRDEQDRKFLLEWSDKCNKFNQKCRSDLRIRVLTKEEVDKFNRGWELFREHFFSLWD